MRIFPKDHFVDSSNTPVARRNRQGGENERGEAQDTRNTQGARVDRTLMQAPGVIRESPASPRRQEEDRVEISRRGRELQNENPAGPQGSDQSGGPENPTRGTINLTT